jgi:Xaa-Pro dipeptidase
MITQAQKHVDWVLESVFAGFLRLGVTEREVAFRLELALCDAGRYSLSFDSIVAFGKNSSVPHHAPAEKKLQAHENILVDCGVQYQGYCSDITRNFFYGKPSNEYRKKYTILQNAQEKTLQKYLPGASAATLDAFCRKQLEPEPAYPHSLGHGVGLEIHELPGVSLRNKKKLQENEVVTCEPGLYYPGKFGIRIEDLLVVRKKAPQILSQASKELHIITCTD